MVAIPTANPLDPYLIACEEQESRRLRWHAVYGACVATYVQNHFVRYLSPPDELHMQLIVNHAFETANEADEAWEKNHEKHT